MNLPLGLSLPEDLASSHLHQAEWTGLFFSFNGLGATPRSVQRFLILHSGIIFACLGDYTGCWGPNLGWSCARPTPYLLHYHSRSFFCFVLLINNSLEVGDRDTVLELRG